MGTQSKWTHHRCSEACPGWTALKKKEITSYQPSSIFTDEVLERKRVYKLLWVLDPTGREENKESAKARPEWTEVFLCPNDSSMLKDPQLRGYIFPVGEGGALMCDYVSNFIPSLIETSFMLFTARPLPAAPDSVL